MAADPDAIGPNGTVRLRCYLPMANSVWFSASCQGRQGCGHVAPIGIRAALRIMGSGEATVGELEQRLRYSRCDIPTRRCPAVVKLAARHGLRGVTLEALYAGRAVVERRRARLARAAA